MCAAHARRSRADEVEESVDAINATKIMFFNIINRQTILSKFRGRYSRFKWYVGTYHVYKRLSPKSIRKLSRLSYITDNLRKHYEACDIIYVTKELTQDGFPHYHFLVGLIKDDFGCTKDLVKIRNTKLWSRKWVLGENFSFHDEDDYGSKVIPFYVRTDLLVLDMGAKQRWFNYGVYKYLLYIFKYSRFRKYEDYFIQN